MNAALNWPSAIGVVLMCALWVQGNQVAAQTLPGPADDDAEYEAEFPGPAEPARREAQSIPAGRARLGITLDARYREAVVRSVSPGGAAEHAGIQPGDTIEALNGNRVASYRDVLSFIDAMRPGDIIDIDFSRRITGRTQAVLDGASPDERTAAYDERDLDRREPIGQATYEQLPAPLYSEGGVPQPMPRADFDPRYRDRNDDRAQDPDEPQRDRRLDRDREPERRRGLFRWRRN
jgi:hypothetical protein